MTGPRFVVYTREDCPLCDEFLLELGQQLMPAGEPVDVRDVDADPAARHRFGLKIPLLTFEGRPVCHGRLDAAAVARLIVR